MLCKFLNILVVGKIARTMIQNGNKTVGIFGRNAQMIIFELASFQDVFFAGASEKRSACTHSETHERKAHFRFPDPAVPIKATM